MAITFTCACGETLTVDDAQRGRRAFCPHCRHSIEIPPSTEAALKAAPKSGRLPDNSASASAAPEVPPGVAPAVAASLHDPASYEGEIFEPPHLDRSTGEDGLDRWKITCFCGKRIVSPLRTDHPVGRCPKCGKRLRLPGYRSRSVRVAAPARPAPPTPGLSETVADMPALAAAARPAPPTPPTPGLSETVAHMPALAGAAPAVPPRAELQAALERLPLAPTYAAGSPSSTLDLGTRPVAAPPAAGPGSALGLKPARENQDDVGTIVMEPLDIKLVQKEATVNREAAIQTADKLRARKAAASAGPDPGRVSAWPLAGRFPRALAGFIDLTLCMMAAGAVVVLASLKLLPEQCLHPAAALAAFLAAGLLNDALLQLFGGGAGKRLVVLVLRDRGGRVPSAAAVMLRALLKWLLIPGWLLALVDPSQRTLHDLLCGTLVLKGRARG